MFNTRHSLKLFSMLFFVLGTALFVRSSFGGTARLGTFTKAFTVDIDNDLNGTFTEADRGDFRTLDCAVKKIRSLANAPSCTGAHPVGGAATYSECKIEASATCDQITIDNPFTIYLAPGVHTATNLSLNDLKGLSIVGLGGAHGTYLTASTANIALTLDNANVKIEGITIGGTHSSLSTQPPIDRFGETGPVTLIVSNCHFNGDAGTIRWSERVAGDNLEISNSYAEFTPGTDAYSFVALLETPDMVRISGCQFRNRGSSVDILEAFASSGTRVIEFSGNTILLTEASVDNGSPAIFLAGDGGELRFYGTGNAIYIDTTGQECFGCSYPLGAIRVGSAGQEGVTKAFLTGNTIHVKSGSNVSAYAVKVDHGGEVFLSGNDIAVTSEASFANGVWATGGSSTLSGGVVHLLGNRIETSGAATTKRDLFQEGSYSTIDAVASDYRQAVGTIGGNLKIEKRLEMTTGTNKCAGSASIGSTVDCFTVNSSCVTTSSMPFVLQMEATGKVDGGLQVGAVTSGSFKVCTSLGTSHTDLAFKWFLIN